MKRWMRVLRGRRKAARGRLLINWVTFPGIGHVVEALRWVQAFRSENPDLEIGLLLHRRGPTVLADCLPVLDRLYAVDVEASCSEDRLVCEPALDRRWDWIFSDPRNHSDSADPSLRRVDELLGREQPDARANHGWDCSGLPAARHRPVRLVLPRAARDCAAARLPPGREPIVSIVPGSAAETSRTPAPEFWRRLMGALRERHPRAAFVLIGSLRARPGQATLGIDRDQLDALVGAFDAVVDAMDLPLLEQLALAARCHVHVSPHTGVSFAIQCVGTPWLALSGAREVEYVFNGVPWSSLYPSCDRYPCGGWVGRSGPRMYPRCEDLARDGQPFECLSTAVLDSRLGEIVDRIDDLLAGRVDYHAELRRHRAEIARRTDLPEGASFLDGGDQVLAPDFRF
jgi:hypothetical protein